MEAGGAFEAILLDTKMTAEVLRARLDRVLDRPEVRSVLLVHQPPSGLDESTDWAWLERFTLPTVFCFEAELGGGEAGAAAACDVRVCGAAASVKYDATTASPGSRQRLQLLVGREGFARLARDGSWSAGQALASGLVSWVVEAGGAQREGKRVAGIIASRGPMATRLATEAVWRGLEMPLAQGLRFETDLTLLLQTTKDRAEGVAAFLEKRPPQFTGE